jgi:hypothetical protein
MSPAMERPSVRDQLLRLRDFQRDTVEYVFEQLYKPANPAMRFLVADEVGLGKTFVARGLIAKVVDHLWDSVDRIDVVYICSNASIARQNINRLNISDAHDVSLPSRITMLPTVIHGLQDRKLNLISLTPHTSFELRSTLGIGEERALLYWLLPEEWRTSEAAVRSVLQGGVERRRFADRVKSFDVAGIDHALQERYRDRLRADSNLAVEFASLCERLAGTRQSLSDEERQAQRDVVGRLRLELAISSLSALEPDLIILDEFQRFKQLLDGTEQAADLARELFTFKGARVVLLSATPYKMFTTSDEATGDDHYRDFLQTIRFLYNDEERSTHFKGLLAGYRDALLTVSTDDVTQLRASKLAVEEALKEVMVRTERLAVTPNRDGMLTEVTPRALELQQSDLRAYVTVAKVAAALDQPDIIEFWKSAPYLLNFMDDYQLKRAFMGNVAGTKASPALAATLAATPEALLSWDEVERYTRIDPANTRLRSLAADTLGQGMWRVLWLPPSLPYYRLSGAFDNPQISTKRLVFSAWHIVPKVVASLLSYEAERLMFEALVAGEERPNSPESREKRRPLLRFARADGRLTGLPLMALLYPSVTLAAEADPLSVFRAGDGQDQTAASVVSHLAARLATMLSDLPESAQAGPPDERWYWAAPLLLDRHVDGELTAQWFAQARLADLWRGETDASAPAERSLSEDPESDGNDAWREHVEMAQRVMSGRVVLGPRPVDLATVLARIAIGGPATLALRALSRITGGPTVLGRLPLRNEAAAIGWAFRTVFNLPEVTALIRGMNAAEPYWLRVVEYCADGCLQSVLDEYAHVLLEVEGVAHRPAVEAAQVVATRLREVLQLRTATLAVDVIEAAGDSRSVSVSDRRMRARFAARYGTAQTDEGASALRQDDVRGAFNSPFWPFVLCSTSVGQEGLDFHPYCHAVVHWNLPSNPVDLEQREGRVHRYKGHAVRRNVARAYGAQAQADHHPDPWAVMFRAGAAARDKSASDLIPFWVFPLEHGATIERHVPALPLSRDAYRAQVLRRALAIYRMAFGQARQEDLIEYLERRLPAETVKRISDELRVDLSPPRQPPWPMSDLEVERIELRAAETTDKDVWALTPSVFELTADRLVDLLEEYVDLVSVATDPAAQYRNLLDAFTTLRDRRTERIANGR